MTRIAGGIAALTLASVLLAGCSSSDPQAPATPTGSNTPTLSTSAPPTTTIHSQTAAPTHLEPTPTFDWSSANKSLESAEDFARHVVETMDYLLHTGNTAPFKATTMSLCKVCTKLIRETNQDARDGVTVRGDSFVIGSITSSRVPSGGVPQVQTLVSVTQPRLVVSKPGAKDEVQPTAKFKIGVRLFWTPAGWRVGGLGE